MAKHLSSRRRLRLRRELETIRGAVEAARILGGAVATSQLGPERDHRRAPRALTCLLTLVDDRLREVRRAARKLDAEGEPRHVREQRDLELRHAGAQLGGEPRPDREPVGGDGGVRRLSADEWALVMLAMRQRGDAVDRRMRGIPVV